MKRATNLSADEVLLDEAKSYGLNLSEVFSEALEKRVRDERKRRWKEENRAALESYNQHVEDNGCFGDSVKKW